ncbi:MAG: hydrogenase maturation nickel metallochaperone HypA [Chloroflexaceae bacterium]|nr:hydrogenase maturation nickel metallochaperone HypA [Chloroflexaceae bacterium]
MHELSIALSLVEIVEEAARRAGAERVVAVHLRLGAMSGVVQEALEFCFPLAAQNTLVEGARLEIETVPLVLACAPCGRDVQPEEGSFRCPFCGAPSMHIRQGRELEVTGVEVPDPEPAMEER